MRKCGSDCPYFLMEEINEEIPLRPDLTIDGKGYWTSCDFETMTEDAAKMLEEVEDDK